MENGGEGGGGIADRRCLRQSPPSFAVIGRVGTMAKLIVAGAALALGLFIVGANGQTLALPDNLAGFSTRDGESYFAESDAREAYFPLASNFLTQKTQAYCGVASIVMVLNALGVPAPGSPNTRPTARSPRTMSSTSRPTPFCRATSWRGEA